MCWTSWRRNWVCWWLPSTAKASANARSESEPGLPQQVLASPAELPAAIGLRLHARVEVSAFSLEQRLQAASRGGLGVRQPQAAQLHGHNLKLLQRAGLARELRKVQTHGTGVKTLLGCDAFIVIDEITAAIKNEPPAVDLDRPRMV